MTLQEHGQVVDTSTEHRKGLAAIASVVALLLVALGGWLIVNNDPGVGPDQQVAETEPGITVTLSEVPKLGGLSVDVWLLPDPLPDSPKAAWELALGGIRFGTVGGSDAPSASEQIHPTSGDLGIDEYEVLRVEPGDYQVFVEAYVSSGPMRYGCVAPIRTTVGRPVEVVITELPEYTGNGIVWSSAEDLDFPSCPM